MITEEHDDSKTKRFSFYCRYCFANTKSECYCNRILGYDPNTGLPIVAISESEWHIHISNSRVDCNTEKFYSDISSNTTDDIDPDSNTQRHGIGDDQEYRISEDLIQDLASLGDSDRASITREAYAEANRIPKEVIDTLVFRQIYGIEAD